MWSGLDMVWLSPAARPADLLLFLFRRSIWLHNETNSRISDPITITNYRSPSIPPMSGDGSMEDQGL